MKRCFAPLAFPKFLEFLARVLIHMRCKRFRRLGFYIFLPIPVHRTSLKIFFFSFFLSGLPENSGPGGSFEVLIAGPKKSSGRQRPTDMHQALRMVRNWHYVAI